MYIQLTTAKTVALLALLLVMATALFMTWKLKMSWYGTTPPFYSLELMMRELALRTRYSFERTFIYATQTASAGSVTLADTQTFEREHTEAVSAYAIPVLTYHRISKSENDFNNVTTKNFRDQMYMLKNAGWETVTLREFEEFVRGERSLPHRSFLLTFDDGAKDSFYPVDPLLKTLGYEAVIYIIAASAHTPESTYYLSPTEIKRLLATGRWEIGSHSYDGHRPYSGDAQGSSAIFFADKLWVPDAARIETEAEFSTRVHDDLSRAREELEQEFNVPINTFAFPLGNETGIQGTANFPRGASITEQTARSLYDIGFLQTNNQDYTFVEPNNSFIARRIHVDHDWDGERLLEIMENGIEKELPWSDRFERNRGWIPAWGSLDLGRNNLTLRALTDTSSASTFLDGSASWDNYSFAASAQWSSGTMFLLADVRNAKTYHACVFSDGEVSIQKTVAGETAILERRAVDAITYGPAVHAGIRVHGAVIECLWDYASVLESYERTATGGIGIQVWNPELGAASLQVSEVLIRDYDATTTPNTP